MFDLLLAEMEIFSKVEWLSWAWNNAGNHLTSVDNDPIWKLKKMYENVPNAAESLLKSLESLTCRMHSASSRERLCPAHPRSASETWGRSSDAEPSSLWWWRSCSQRWGLPRSPHSGRVQKGGITHKSCKGWIHQAKLIVFHQHQFSTSCEFPWRRCRAGRSPSWRALDRCAALSGQNPSPL